MAENYAQRCRETFCFLQAWQGQTCQNKEKAGQLRSRAPADSRPRPMVVARGPGLYEPMQAEIISAEVDVREPGLDLNCRGHWRTPGRHLADKAPKAPKRPEVAGEALTLPANYRISVAGAARPISSMLAEMHARTSEKIPKCKTDKWR